MELLQKYATSLVSRDPKTVRKYLSILEEFIAWLAKQPGGAPFAPELVTETAINSYLNHLKSEKQAPRTRSQKLSAIRGFCRWAIGQGYLTRNPAAQIVNPTVVNTAPRELTHEQRYVLKNRVEMERSLRLSAIFALGYWAGLRVSEVAELKRDACQINQRSGQITIHDGKGGKSRTIDLHNEARRVLHDYMSMKDTLRWDAPDPDSQYLFTSQRSAWLRQKNRPDHLSVRGIEYMWSKLKQQARTDEYELIHDIRFHDLRHDFAHRAREAGWTLEEIAVYLGHQTRDGAPAIMTTVRYTLPSRKQLKRKLKDLQG